MLYKLSLYKKCDMKGFIKHLTKTFNHIESPQ